jgi:beta-lactamase class A
MHQSGKVGKARRPTLLPVFLVLAITTGCSSDSGVSLREAVELRMAESGAETVGFYFRSLDRPDSLLLSADTRVHAASMMKVPVLIQLFLDQEAGLLSLDDSVTITKTFRSIVDGSPYDLSAPEDSDTILYRRVGESESIRQLAERMITVSSNLATNILIERVGADRTQQTMRELGADSIVVLRGVEDIKAFEAGLSNTTTARDLGVIFTAIAQGRAAGPESCREMEEILLRQEFNEGIPAGLPADVKVGHKTGSIIGIRHDGGIVLLPDGRRYVLVILTRGLEDPDDADRLIPGLSGMVYEHLMTGAAPAA